jgi:hypothetical protein
VSSARVRHFFFWTDRAACENVSPTVQHEQQNKLMPTLVASYKTKEEIPAALAEYYKEDNGEFVLDAADMEPASRVSEFRNTSVTLKKFLGKFGIKKADDEKEVNEVADLFKTLRERKDLLDEKKLIKDDKVEEVVESRLKKARGEWDIERGGLESKNKDQAVLLSKLVIEQKLVDEATKLGVKAEHLEDVKNRGLKVFKLEDGAAVAYDEKGEKKYGKDTKPLSIVEFMQDVLKTAPGLFNESKGTGAQGSGQGAGNQGGRHAGPNPWKKETWSQYQQGQILKRSHEEAKRLAAEAGVKLTIPT